MGIELDLKVFKILLYFSPLFLYYVKDESKSNEFVKKRTAK